MISWIDVVLAVISVIATYFLRKYSKKVKEILSLVETVENSLKDGKLTEDELKQIIAKIKKIFQFF